MVTSSKFHRDAVNWYDGHLGHELVQDMKAGAGGGYTNVCIAASKVSYMAPDLKIPKFINQTVFLK